MQPSACAVPCARFGADAVFIDRDIPAGADWADSLDQQLQQATDVIVLVGDAFITELRSRSGSGSNKAAETGTQDWLKTEIEAALRLRKQIYPLIIGRLEMPDRSLLPPEISGFADAQALFAREPAFDAAVAKLADAIAAARGWLAPLYPQQAAQRGPGQSLKEGLVAPAGWLAAALALPLLSGCLIQWLVGGGARGDATLSALPAFWLGLHYLLLTALWGLGPYLLYRSVAEVRVRAGLPAHNPMSMLTLLSLCIALLAGGSFMLLSTRADWALRLLWVMPAAPSPLQYALQGGVLVTLVFAAVGLAMLEPLLRQRSGAARQAGMRALLAAGFAVLLANLWFAASVQASLPPLEPQQTVPFIGYFMLTPALPALLISWDFACARLGLSSKTWHNRTLLSLALAIYLVCTLAYFANGPVGMMARLPL
ncbi:hypothetical protein HNP55_001942 [Paucibacter oligotrophus]|uniref:TIR domain-containing protein n=1 Tax=Roseateles oligotrophus TaxID=1769250 RepID=A0A840L9J3_9BURK|nr:TIR domain-containing protein [Roseateles oligotrophus]MBB4843423.1 hypothetical protein [Roseateles oligotrophus]